MCVNSEGCGEATGGECITQEWISAVGTAHCTTSKDTGSTAYTIRRCTLYNVLIRVVALCYVIMYNVRVCHGFAILTNLSHVYIHVHVQWNPYNPDTVGPEESVLIREVSLFQGLKSTQTWYLGRKKVSCLSSFQGCPYRGIPIDQAMHNTYME